MSDNLKQIEEIRNYVKHLYSMTGVWVAEDVAAVIWIRKYAKVWRLTHGRNAAEDGMMEPTAA